MSRTKHHGSKMKYKRYGDRWLWYRQEPKWWRKEKKHKPQRAACRQAKHKVMEGEEEVSFPLDKKPWTYYW